MGTYSEARNTDRSAERKPQGGRTDDKLTFAGGTGAVAQRRAADPADGGTALPTPKNDTGLPDGLKNGLEKLSGYSMDDVKVHYNSAKPAQLYAHAYAQGTQIHLGPGQEKHLPHEAWHVVQQKQGRVAATTQLKGMGVNTDSGLEHEADRMGGLASRAGYTPNQGTPVKASAHAAAPVQAFGWEDLGWLNPRRYMAERIGGYDASTMEKINKKKLVEQVLTQNVKSGKDGWFYLRDEQMETYTQRVFALLDEIRNSDMNVLMIAHQQTNMESEASPEDKVKTLAKYKTQTDEEIAKLADFDIPLMEQTRTAKQQQRRQLVTQTPQHQKDEAHTQQVQALTDDMANLSKRIMALKKGGEGKEEREKLDKLKKHRERLLRESALQQAQAGKKGINVDMLNTTETDEDDAEFVRLYMAIVAPNFDNKYKDFYLNDKQKLTYSANDKVMWVSFGTPFRTLSWFQKYAFDARGDNVPLVRSFKIPARYLETFMKDLTTEDEEMAKGKPLAHTARSLDLETFYGSDFKGEKYDTEISVIEPHLMNVDVKYPNQFGLGRILTTEERPKDRDFFKRTKKMETERQEEYDHGLFDEQIESLNAKIAKLQGERDKLYDEEYEGQTAEGHREAIGKLLKEVAEWDKVKQLEQNKNYLARLGLKPEEQALLPQDGHDEEPEPDADRLKIIRRILEGEKMAPPIKMEQGRLADIKQKKKEAEDRVKSVTGGNAKLKAELARITDELKNSHNPSGIDLASASMSQLLKQAVPGSFKTIALAKDRKFEHMPAKEGPLEDYPDFMGSLGLSPTAHFLDSEHTAFHNLGKEGWASQSPGTTANIYSKMRFFYHGIDTRVSGADPLAKVKGPDKMDEPDISRDSHLKEIVRRIKAKNIPDEKMRSLAAIHAQADPVRMLAEILDMNRLTPSDVFGLPKQHQSDRRDRHGNLMVRAGAETYFAERNIASEKSLAFIAENVQNLIAEIDNPKKAKGLVAKLLENAYLKRDIQELLGERTPDDDGIKEEIPYNKESIIKALNRLKEIDKEPDRHKQLRMVYLFFHVLRPYAQELGTGKGKKTAAKPRTTGKLQGDVEVNNRTDKLDHFDFLNPRPKTFGLLEGGMAPSHEPSDMPYDKFRSPQRYVPKEGSKSTDYMREQELPFVGGVSGTTRDQTQVLEQMFDPKTLKDHYWDFQLMNAAFMIGNGYHSFFETVYVAARYDHYTPIGEKVLAEFDRAKAKKVPQHQIYRTILELIDADSHILDGFEAWYDARVNEGETDQADTASWIDYRKKRYGLSAATDKTGGGTPATAKASGQTTGKQPAPSGSGTATRPDINEGYLYEDNDIQALLTLRVQQLGLPNIHVMAAVDDVTGGQLRQLLIDNAEQHGGTARTLLIPYNLGRYHWIGVVIRIGENEENVTVEVMDPLRATAHYRIPARITHEVQQQYAGAIIRGVAHKIQQDASSCGVLTIENLVARAANVGLPADEEVARGAALLREAHANLMTRHRPEANFAHRQKFGLHSFSSFDVRKYTSGKGSGAVSLSEMKGMLEIIHKIKRLPQHKEITDSFALLNQKGKELKDVLAALRSAFRNIIPTVASDTKPDPKTDLMAILDAIFEMGDKTIGTVGDVNMLKVRNVTLIENISAYIEKSDELEKDDVMKKK